MEIIDYKKIMDTRAPESQRRLVEISREDISPHYSSLTDFMDAALGYEPNLLRHIDRLISHFLLGAVCKVVNGHYGTVLPKINGKGAVVGGSVVYFSAESGNVLFHEPITGNLYRWYCFDYFTDDDVFFGEHLLSGRNIAVRSARIIPCRSPGAQTGYFFSSWIMSSASLQPWAEALRYHFRASAFLTLSP